MVWAAKFHGATVVEMQSSSGFVVGATVATYRNAIQKRPGATLPVGGAS